MKRQLWAVATGLLVLGCATQRVGGVKLNVPPGFSRGELSDPPGAVQFTEASGAMVTVASQALDVEEGSRGETPQVCTDRVALKAGAAKNGELKSINVDGFPAYRVLGTQRSLFVGCDGFTAWWVEVKDPRGKLATQIEATIHYAHAGKGD